MNEFRGISRAVYISYFVYFQIETQSKSISTSVHSSLFSSHFRFIIPKSCMGHLVRKLSPKPGKWTECKFQERGEKNNPPRSSVIVFPLEIIMNKHPMGNEVAKKRTSMASQPRSQAEFSGRVTVSYCSRPLEFLKYIQEHYQLL